MSKKATIPALTDVIIGIMFTIVLFVLIFKFYPLLSTPKCENSADFDSISKILDKLDTGDSLQEEIFFNNYDCKIVSFSSQQAYNKISAPSKNPKTNAYLCLCILEDGNCKPYKCKGLLKITQINKEQFSTEDFKDYTFLTFIKDNTRLNILTLSKEIINEDYEDPEGEELDTTLLLPEDIKNIDLAKEQFKTIPPEISCTHRNRELGCDLKEDALNALLKAEEIAKKYNKQLQVTSATRTEERQREKWNEYQNRRLVCGPNKQGTFSHCPHVSGGAVDICFIDYCDHSTTAQNTEQKKLLGKIMCEAGFVRYSGEWWHFEYGTNMWKNTKTKYPNACASDGSGMPVV